MTSPFNHLEILSAAPDAIFMAMGGPVAQPHPLASSLSLRDIAAAAGERNAGKFTRSDSRQLVALGLSSGDFSKLLSTSAGQLILNNYQAQSQHGEFCTVVKAKNFKPVAMPAIDADVSLEPLAESAEIVYGAALIPVAPNSASLTSYAKIVALTREAIYNDDLLGFSKMVADLGSSAARLEARLVAGALAANPLLDDGQTVFDLGGGDTKNNVVNAVFSGPALGDAMQKLRTQLTSSGQRADLVSKHLVVAPDLEYSARVILKDFGLAISLHVLSELPVGRWFLLCDTKIHPVIGTLRLGDSATPIRVEAQVKRADGNDGAAVRVIADLGAVMLSRTGIVRGGV